MLSTKIRTIIISSVAVAALSVPGVASAMVAIKRPGALAVVQPVRAIPMEAGSAGIPGYDDAKCEGLLNDYNTTVNESEAGLREGDSHRQQYYGELANRIEHQMTDNCLVVD